MRKYIKFDSYSLKYLIINKLYKLLNEGLSIKILVFDRSDKYLKDKQNMKKFENEFLIEKPKDDLLKIMTEDFIDRQLTNTLVDSVARDILKGCKLNNIYEFYRFNLQLRYLKNSIKVKYNYMMTK